MGKIKLLEYNILIIYSIKSDLTQTTFKVFMWQGLAIKYRPGVFYNEVHLASSPNHILRLNYFLPGGSNGW